MCQTVLLYCISDVTWFEVVSGVLKDSRTRGSNDLKSLQTEMRMCISYQQQYMVTGQTAQPTTKAINSVVFFFFFCLPLARPYPSVALMS